MQIIRLWVQLIAALFKRARAPKAPFALGNDLGSRIARAMLAHGYTICTDPGAFNIVYVEGMDADGTPNRNRYNAFDDIRVLLQVERGQYPRIVHIGEATTEPGKFWTDNRMNPDGAFHIALGQQTCWQYGEYHGAPALVQVGPIKGYRDGSNHYRREGPLLTEDNIGVHHHGGYDLRKDDLGRSSAGCQVERLVSGHLKFMVLLRTDARYRADRRFKFTSTVMPAAWVQ